MINIILTKVGILFFVVSRKYTIKIFYILVVKNNTKNISEKMMFYDEIFFRWLY